MRWIGGNTRRGLGALLSAQLAVAVVVAGCGDGAGDQASDRGEIRAAIERTRTAFAAGDLKAVCASLTKDGQRQVGAIGHDILGDVPPTPCVQDLPVYYKGVKKSAGLRRGANRVLKIDVDGDAATATVAMGTGTASVPLAREEGEWKVDALYGGVPASQQEDHY